MQVVKNVMLYYKICCCWGLEVGRDDNDERERERPLIHIRHGRLDRDNESIVNLFIS